MTYDSAGDTQLHIDQVGYHLREVVVDLLDRRTAHDASKLVEPEKSVFDEFSPKLRELTYGSDEYKDSLAHMTVALDHHYKVNDHHPEHFVQGVREMNLVQIIEMLCDWKAATMRHDDGDLRKSIDINAERFGYGEELRRILVNTAEYFNWL